MSRTDHVSSLMVTWCNFATRYRPVAAQMHPKCKCLGLWKPCCCTYGSLEVTFDHVPSHHVIWLPLPVSYRLAAAEMQQKREYIGIPGPVGAVPVWWHYLRVTWGHFWLHECKLQACCCYKAPQCKYLALRKLCEVSSSLTMPLLGPGGHFHSYDITFGLMTRFSCTLDM